MAHITVISIGTLKESYLKDALEEYKKRLSQYAKLKEVELKEERINNELDHCEIERALDKEADKVLASMPEDSLKIALCIEGKAYSSEELADIVRSAEDKSGKICLVIGSSHGLSRRVKDACDIKLSFSKMTFPHQLMRVILFEALYRSYTIIHGKRYHK